MELNKIRQKIAVGVFASLTVAVPLVVIWFMTACSTAPSVRTGKGDVSSAGAKQAGKELSQTPGWAGNMQGMARQLESLLPYVMSGQEFSDPANRDKIVDMVEGYSKSISGVPAHVGEKMLGDDPIIRYSLKNLQEDSRLALKGVQEGRSEFARTTLRQSISACFNCHTTQQLGPENNFSTAKLSSKFRMYPTERAEYYVATRQFDRAVEVLEGVLANPAPFYDEPHEQSIALKKYLALMVRVKKDPVRAANVIEKYLTTKRPPIFLASEAETWLKSLNEWNREKKPAKDPLNKARSLLNRAEKMQSGAGFQAGYVENLRATALLHDVLRTTSKPEGKAELYAMLGHAYDVLSVLGLWDLPEVYYEECVRIAPKTIVSKKCYRDFERAIILGFSGSSGTFIPAPEREKLAELKSLAGL